MRILFYISIFISGLITAFMFFFAHRLTVSFDPANDLLGGGNGNPACFLLLLQVQLFYISFFL